MGNIIVKQELKKLIQAGLRFEVSQGKLQVRGNLSVLSDEDKQFLKVHKEAIISLIEHQTHDIPVIQKVNNNAPKPLSFSQQGLWLLDKISEGSNHYNLVSAFRLKGKLNYTALDQTFLTIVQRHESLRSTFLVDISGEPVQKVQEVNNFIVPVEEINASADNYELQAAQIIREEAHRVFDLTKDLLLSVRLVKLSDEEHILIVNMHHIASDGWSRGILVKEFSVLYSSFVQGEPNPLPDLSIQYTDYAYWQRQWLKVKVLEEQTNFWKDQLSGLPVLHNLPLDKPRPLMQSFKGSTYTSRIPKGMLTALYDLCQSEAASLFMGIHAAFSTLLSRYSNETDIVVGCPIANRERAETAGLVGFFMNLLVLRSDLSQKPGFRELIRQSKKMLEEAYQYQQMPFEKLVDELKVKRNLGHNPLFQILLSLQNNQKEEISIPGLVMEPVNYAANSAKYDLSLNISENAEGLLLSWEYNTDLFEASAIERMAGHFKLLLMGLLAEPDENVFKLNMVSEEESLGMYKYLKGESVEVKSEESAINSFNYQVAHKPDETAIICNDISYNYKELGKKVNAIAALLSGQGVQRGDKVGIYLVRNMEMVATIFACFKLGAAYIPLDPVYASGRINQIIADAQPKCIVTLQALQKAYLKEHAKENFLCLDKSGFEEEYINSGSEYRDENVAYIIFTSGTTGKPKGIEVTHGNLTNLLKGLDISFSTGTKQQWLAQTSINFDISVLELIWTISRGHSVVLQQTNPFKLLSPNQLGIAKEIEFSVMFFGADKNNSGQKYDLLLETAKFADKNDLTAIWTPERHFGEFGGAFANPSIIGATIAAITEKINIRAGSVVLPLHDPIRVAEEWSMIDNLSGGRVGVSIASGWHPNDFVFYNADFRDRHKQMRDKIAELKNLWNGIPVERKNGVDKNIPIKIRPYPIQKELPLWITAAGSPETFKYAGEIGANILTHMLGQSLEKLAGNIAIYHQALRDNGFIIEDKKVSLMLHTYMDITEQTALGISEQPFKDYLRSSIQLMEPLAKETGLDINTQMDDLIEMAFRKFSKENTLIGSPESCQEMLHGIRNIGVTEVACLVDFGVESEKVLKGLENIVKAKELYHSHVDLIKLLHIEDQKTELDLIHEYKVTHVQMTPSQAKLIVDLHEQVPDKELSSVQYWFIGGEAISQGLVKGLSAITDARLFNMYGPTETTVWSAWRQINAADVHIGQPIINTDLVLLNEFEQQVPVGVAGELYIGGSGVAKGYYNNAELTNKSFKNISSPYGKGRFYKTGDLMKLDAHGTLEFAGRKDNQVKVNGYRIELEEIETTIARVPGVKNCKVVPVKNDNTASLSAYVVKKDIVYGDYQDVLPEEQARPFHLPDGSLVYHQSNRQLAMMYKEIMERRIYFRHGISVPENALILDIGANVGAFSIDVSREHPDATIIAFEPIPQIFSALKKNFEHWQIKGCVLNYGASNKKEKANFHYYPEMAGMSGRFADGQTIVNAVGKYMEHDKEMLQKDASYFSEDRVEIVKSFYDTIEAQKGLSDEVEQYLSSLYKSQEVECQLTTVSDVIDELNIQAIDLLKLDVEKSECLVLEGIRSEHWSMIRQLAIEVDGDTNLGIIKNLLREKGYDIHVDDFVMSDENAPKEENTYMLYAVNPHYGQQQNDAVLERLQAQVSEATVRDFLERELPEYMNPADIIFVPSIPLMENGKVNMLKLKEFKPAKTVSEPTVILTNKTELEIYRMWCEVLKKENIPHHLSIFEAGGSSIAIVLLHQKLQTAFNVNFSLIELFRNPTIPQQAKLIQNANGKESITVTKAMNKGASRRNLRATRLTNTNSN